MPESRIQTYGPGRLEHVTPVLQQRGYVPEVDKRTIVYIAGESIEAVVKEVVHHDAIIVTLSRVPVGKGGSGLRKGDLICCMRQKDTLLGVEKWVHVDDRQLEQNHAAAEFAQRERQRLRDEEEARKIAILADHAAAEEANAVPHGTKQPARTVLGPRRSNIKKG